VEKRHESITADDAKLASQCRGLDKCRARSAHPDHIAKAEGWLIEAFTDFGAGFTAPMPWYFRPLASWEALLTQNGFMVESIIEPIHPITQNSLSLLLISRY
jgi:hypothetical protein